MSLDLKINLSYCFMKFSLRYRRLCLSSQLLLPVVLLFFPIGWRFSWPMKMQELYEAKLQISIFVFWLYQSALHSSCNFLNQLKRKPPKCLPKSCQKPIKECVKWKRCSAQFCNRISEQTFFTSWSLFFPTGRSIFGCISGQNQNQRSRQVHP